MFSICIIITKTTCLQSTTVCKLSNLSNTNLYLIQNKHKHKRSTSFRQTKRETTMAGYLRPQTRVTMRTSKTNTTDKTKTLELHNKGLQVTKGIFPSLAVIGKRYLLELISKMESNLVATGLNLFA